MKRLIYLVKRWLVIFRIKRFRKQLILKNTLKPEDHLQLLGVVVQFLMLLDESLFDSIDIKILRKLEVAIHYRLEQHLNILEFTSVVLTSVTHDLNSGGKYITANIVASGGMRWMTLANYLSDTDGKTLLLPEYVKFLRENNLSIYQHLITIEDEGDKWYYQNRLKLFFQDMYVITNALINILESSNE